MIHCGGLRPAVRKRQLGADGAGPSPRGRPNRRPHAPAQGYPGEIQLAESVAGPHWANTLDTVQESIGDAVHELYNVLMETMDPFPAPEELSHAIAAGERPNSSDEDTLERAD